MKHLFIKSLLCFLPFGALQAQVFFEENQAPKDQFRAFLEITVYTLYKVLDFANDHGFRYIKILAYEFAGFDHVVTGAYIQEDQNGGRFFKLKDELLTISFLCFQEAPSGRNFIDLEEYRSLIDKVEEGSSDFFE